MPSVSIHMALADRVLERWRRRPRTAPFDPFDRADVNAFRQGSIGPDLGYFPGGYRPLSDLAHRVRSVDLTRTLIDRARSSRERAFSWGWSTHVLADGAIHPLVGRGVGEVVLGDADRFVAGQVEPAVHLRVEIGLDIAFVERNRPPHPDRLEPVFDRHSIAFLIGAYRSTYGIQAEEAPFLVSHRRAARMTGPALAVTRGLARIHAADSPSWSCNALRRALASVHRELAERRGTGRLALGYFNPLPASPWLIEAVDREAGRFANLFEEQYETRLANLENFDLDSGLVDRPGHPSAAAREVLRHLQGSRGRPQITGAPAAAALGT